MCMHTEKSFLTFFFYYYFVILKESEIPHRIFECKILLNFLSIHLDNDIHLILYKIYLFHPIRILCY